MIIYARDFIYRCAKIEEPLHYVLRRLKCLFRAALDIEKISPFIFINKF